MRVLDKKEDFYYTSKLELSFVINVIDYIKRTDFKNYLKIKNGAENKAQSDLGLKEICEHVLDFECSGENNRIYELMNRLFINPEPLGEERLISIVPMSGDTTTNTYIVTLF